MNTAVFTLRCKQAGFSLSELDYLPLDLVMSVFTEQGNDNFDYPLKADQSAIDRL